MQGNIRKYFACSNTGKGFANLFASNLKGLKKIFILKGGPGTGKSSLMKKIGTFYSLKGYDIEYIYCCSDVESLDGVVIRKLKIAIVDGTAPHVIEPTAPGALEEYVNLGIAWDTKELALHTDEILKLQQEIQGCYLKVYEVFAHALKIHDEWEKIYIGEMNFEDMNELTQEVIENLLKQVSFEKESIVMDRFFGGATYKGPFDFVEEITENMKTRYFIKGRPGTGKSTMLKRILAEAVKHGMDVNVYHCGFDPDSLDMLEFPELSMCIFDSTAPHEYDVSREGDCIIDVYENIVTKGTDETFEESLTDIKARYKVCMDEGIEALKKAKDLHDQLEQFYIQATNFDVINKITVDLIDRIAELEDSKEE